MALPSLQLKGNDLSGSGSTTGFDSYGKLFLTSCFKKEDLSGPRTLEGGTIYQAGAGGYLLGASGSLMLLGINRAFLFLGLKKPELIGVALRSAPALLATLGVNEGLQNSAGAAFMLGQITYKGLYSDDD